MNCESLSASAGGGAATSTTRYRKVRRTDSVTDAVMSVDDGRPTGNPREERETVVTARGPLVVAGEELPAGILSEEMTSITPIDVGTVFWGEADFSAPSLTVCAKSGKITSDVSWMQHVRLARHCQMQNMQIIHDDRGVFYLQASRTISKGEALYAWFTLETAKIFQIPYLTLSNIQGGWQYKCHQCDCVYKDPNPLKIHLAFYCTPTDTESKPVVRNVNSPHLASSSSSISLVPPGGRRQPSAFKPPSKQNSLDQSTSTSHINEKNRKNKMCSGHRMVAPFSVCPADRLHFANPSILNHSPSSTIQSTSAPPCVNLFAQSPPSYLEMALPNFLHCPNSLTSLYANLNVRSGRREDHRFQSPSDPSSVHAYPTISSATSTLFKPNSFLYPVADFSARPEISNQPSVTASPRETLASQPINERPMSPSESEERLLFTSDSKIRKKHKCFYCGKMYSRKYGLKIHIRTHTGFKPLSCKYCHRLFSDPSNLNKHVRLHAEGLTPYRCHLCSKVLVRKRDLDRHLKSRHPPKSVPKTPRECGAPLVETLQI